MHHQILTPANIAAATSVRRCNMYEMSKLWYQLYPSLLNSPGQPVYLQRCSEAIMQIKRAYDEQGITIPFPSGRWMWTGRMEHTTGAKKADNPEMKCSTPACQMVISNLK